MAAKRRAPNILVTGTPGTGKSTTCEQIAEATQLRHINVGDWVKDQGLHCGWDDEHQSYLLDEDKACLPSFLMDLLQTCRALEEACGPHRKSAQHSLCG